VAGLLASVILIEKPNLINRAEVPKIIWFGKKGFIGPALLGLTLKDEERKPRIDELQAAAVRMYVSDSYELLTDSLVRANEIQINGKDPGYENKNFGSKLNEPFNGKANRAGSLITSDQRKFIKECAYPLRNIVRHYAAVLPEGKSVNFNGEIDGHSINISVFPSTDQIAAGEL